MSLLQGLYIDPATGASRMVDVRVDADGFLLTASGAGSALPASYKSELINVEGQAWESPADVIDVSLSVFAGLVTVQGTQVTVGGVAADQPIALPAGTSVSWQASYAQPYGAGAVKVDASNGVVFISVNRKVQP